MIPPNVKERNAAPLAVITLLCNPVSSSRLHTLILSENVRENGEGGARGREDRQQTGEWDLYLGDGGKKEG